MSTKTVYAFDPGEIRPAKSEYEKWWEFTAGPFANSIRTDRVLQAASTGIFTAATFSYGEIVVTQSLPYVVRGGQTFYSMGVKVYNNPWGKRIIIVFNKTVNSLSSLILYYWILHYRLCFEGMSWYQFLIYHQIKVCFSPMCQIEIETIGYMYLL